jgi:CheY-like chemotaxis protein
LIDDEENEHILVRAALKRGRIPIILESFKNPAEAIAKLASIDGNFPDLILCDFDLGTMTGADFVKWLRTSHAAAIPVIIRSNSNAQRDVDLAYQNGANCYLQKGFDFAAIEENLKLLLHFWTRMCMPEVKPTA